MEKLFAKNLKFLRTQKKLSQEHFSTEIGLNRGNIASYENGTAEPNINNILKIVKYFNIDLSDIVEKDLAISNEFVAELRQQPEWADQVVDKAEGLMKEELEDHSNKLERFLGQSNDMQKIVEGFKSFYLYKRSKGPIDLEKMAKDYEDLLELMESLLISHNELITFLEKKR